MTELDRDHEEALRALAPMREGPLAVAGRAQEQAALRSRVLETLRMQVEEVPAQLRGRRQRRVWLRVASASAVLAAAAAVAIVWLPRQAEPASASLAPVAPPSAVRVEAIDDVPGAAQVAPVWIDDAGRSHTLIASSQGAGLPTGTLELRSNDTAPRLRTSQGVELKLSPKARLRVRNARADEGAELRLLDGEIACAVPKLGATRQFAIDAPGARVIVHGTRFSVRATGGKTCVRVTEGLVAVHPEASDAPVRRLGPGDQWGCEVETAREPVRIKRPRTTARAMTEPELETSSEPEPTGTLDAENRLLAEALSAERKNDRARAQRLFAELLRKHPSSPLAVDAAAGLQRTRE